MRVAIAVGLLGISATPVQAQATASFDAARAAAPVQRGFAGFSLEMSSIGSWSGSYNPTTPASFDFALVNLLNLLGSYEGPPVVRIGGNAQDWMWLASSTQTSPPAFAYTAAPALIAFTHDNVDALGWVQRFTGAPFTIGLNMGGNLPSAAVAELTAFQSSFDPQGILAYDIGNEPDEAKFISYRPMGWNISAYQANLLTFLGALRSVAPNANFAAPAVGNLSWLPPNTTAGFNALLGAISGQIAFVTGHIYVANALNPPSDPIGILFLPGNSSAIATDFTATQSAANAFGLGVRINETNTYFNGGLAGVSDSFAAALWIADVLGSYSQAGVLGVNFHGGTGLPYSPFTMTADASGYSVAAKPVYYGMMLFAQFIQNGAGVIFPLVSSVPSTASVYASRDGAGALRVLLINKSLTSAATLTVTFTNLGGKYQNSGALIQMQAPSISATTGLTLGGQSYDATGAVVGSLQSTSVPGNSGSFSWQVPAASAGLFTLDLQSPVPPSASAQVLANSLVSGGSAVFVGSAAGTAPFGYQWLFNGNPVAGATGIRFVIPAVQVSNAGQYSLRVSNAAGSVTSNSVDLTVQPQAQVAPTITGQPQSATVAAGAGFSLAVAASGTDPISYQWSLNGSPISGATNPLFVLTGATAANAGSYTCSATNSAGSVTSIPAQLTVATTNNPGRLINISCRAQVGTGANVLIAGLVVGGSGTSGSESLLIRASGPALAPFGVPGVLSDPALQFNNSTSLVASNGGWGGNATVASTAAAVGAFAWPSASSHDAALLEAAPAGGYSAEVSGQSGDTGVALVEAYDATPAGTYTLATPRLINISARVQVGTGSNVLIAGFVVGGATSETVLIRASGPALIPFGVTGTLADPVLTLNNATSTVATNTGWGGNPQIATIAARVGAFSWGIAPTADSALMVTLPPGAYSAEVSGASGDAGVALIEIYEVQ